MPLPQDERIVALANDLLPQFDQLFGLRRGAVIGDQHLEVGIALVRERPQHRIERVGTIIGRDDDGDAFGHDGTAPNRC